MKAIKMVSFDTKPKMSSDPNTPSSVSSTQEAHYKPNGDDQSLSHAAQPRVVKSVTRDGDFVTIGDQTFRHKDLANIFVNDLDSETYRRRPRAQRLANPVPLGLASFSFCCLVLSLVNARVRGVTVNQLLVSSFLFFGGAIELFAGLLCFVTGDTYAMTVFSAFGGFWISWGCVFMDQFGVAAAYADDPKMFQNVTGFFLAGWAVFTFLVWLCSMKSTWGLFLLLGFLELTFLMLCIGSFIGSDKCLMAGGYFGILSSCCGWYSLYCGISNQDNGYMPLRAYPMPNAATV
ncbi:hypothetical protein HG537_0A04790 [Torulaspora globosa]|uniref:Uncharacterized protein n=1 Tax=Torulaspora globosa TaxID=48254 RepID=A0A7H9HPK2_9SACH|nr:hypothetical protein HG537_0A04790 [Torulaspora sp. CBS 2947]